MIAEDGYCPVLRELGIGFVAYSPLGRGFLTGQIRSLDDLDDDDFRKPTPASRATTSSTISQRDEVFGHCRRKSGRTPAQVSLAWLLAQGDDIAPIPGTKRVSRLEENIAADAVELSPAQSARLDQLTPAAGEHHNEAQMRMIER